MNTYPTIYIDEAGNTGSNVLNCNQPYFVLSAVHFTDAELVQLQKYIMVGSINSIFYFLHKAAEPFNCLEQDNLTQS